MSPRRAPRLRRLGRAAAAGAIVVALAASAACGLPHRGPVRLGLDVGSPNMPPVRLELEAPARGASAEQIVRGFLAASWSIDDDFAAARSYLTPQASRAWSPQVGVTVYPDGEGLQVQSLDASTIRLHAQTVATLDASGRYDSSPPGATSDATLRLTMASGEWRISALPADFGVWVSRFYFERALRAFSIAYADLAMERIVVDRRWFWLGPGLTTRVARALLDTPPTYLQGAVRSGFPAGTRLSVDSVPVELGQARVDLSPGVLDVTAEERRAAWAQALVTLRQLPAVDGVTLQVSGADLDVALAGQDGGLPTDISQLGFTAATPAVPQVLWRSAAELVAVDVADLARRDERPRATGAPLPTVPVEWTDLAAGRDTKDLAAVSTDRTRLHRWRGGQEADTPGLGSDLTPPAYDRHGLLWLGGSAPQGGSRIWFVDANAGLAAGAQAVAAPWLDARGEEELVAVRPAPDGQRMLIVSRRGDTTQIGLSGVLQDPVTRKPVGLTEPWPIGGDVQQVRSAVWVSNTMVAVIGARTAGSQAMPMLVPVGGPTSPLPSVPDPREIASTGGDRGIVVLSGDGYAYGRVGGGWQQLGLANDLVVPGP